ncbi:predicted protein [Coccidioides posadasii str. Silveira]|uniref:Predicted protein n=1 Tax=Coccidioides posadasii (strain RMSCC 757 / Silveira) TaxID=443226 RepID=E9D151_COCPS|nr:predicted protein [Coccidioides posadasii str. Silveira]
MPRNRSSSLPQPLASALLLTSQKGTPAAQPFRPPPPFHAIVSRLSIGVYRNIMQPSVPETIIQTIDSIIDGILCPVWFSFNFTCDIIMKAIVMFHYLSFAFAPQCISLTRTDRVAAESTILTP